VSLRPDVLAAAAALRAEPDRTCLMTDFDGTLAPIVDDPWGAVALPGTTDVLHQLARSYATVAVVSGRPGTFLRDALDLGASNLEAYGVYGAEHVTGDGGIEIDPTVAARIDDIARVAIELARALPPEVTIEEKTTSVVLHWRRHPWLGDIALSIATHVAESADLEIQLGKMTVELSPPGAPDKGAVVRLLAAGARAACFLGDDTGDIPAFEALAALAGGGSGGSGSGSSSSSSGGGGGGGGEATGAPPAMTIVRIAIASDESPPRLIEQAELVLESPQAVVEFLGLLLPG